MIKATCDHCGKEEEVRISASLVVLSNSLKNAIEDVEDALHSGSQKLEHQLLAPNGWVTAPKTIPKNGGPATAWVACNMEHALLLERQMRAEGRWETEDGAIPREAEETAGGIQ